MNLVLLSDLHLAYDRPAARLDDVAKTCYRKMDFVLSYAESHSATILQGGDFFDKPRSWHLLVPYIRLLDLYKDVPIYCVFGQHDQYFRSRKDTLLDALSAAGYVTILSKEPVVWGGDAGHQVCIYGSGYGEDIPVPVGSSDCDILVVHASISDRSLWPGHDYIQAKRFLLRNQNFSIILCGDIHRKFFLESEGRIICNCGPMFRRSVDLWEHEPGFWVYDTDTGEAEWVGIPHEPAETVLSRRHIEEREETNKMLEDFIAAMPLKDEMGQKRGPSFQDNLSRFIKENEVDEGVVKILSEIMSDAGGSG